MLHNPAGSNISSDLVLGKTQRQYFIPFLLSHCRPPSTKSMTSLFLKSWHPLPSVAICLYSYFSHHIFLSFSVVDFLREDLLLFVPFSFLDLWETLTIATNATTITMCVSYGYISPHANPFPNYSPFSLSYNFSLIQIQSYLTFPRGYLAISSLLCT